jgi:hypothetical protein
MKDKRQFILDTLLPFVDGERPTATEGIISSCRYLTKDGRKCAVGLHMLEGKWQHEQVSAELLFNKYPKEQILTSEALDQNLKYNEWYAMQEVHDIFAQNPDALPGYVGRLEEISGLKFPELLKAYKNED